MEAPHGSDLAHIPVLPLSERHRATLEAESAISPDIIAGRGYGTIRSRAEVPRAFKKYQRRAPALLVPMYSPDGTSTLYQIRPDNPRRTGKGKHTKYETPAGAKVIADVHPHMMDAVKDASRSLFITEGVKCGDSLNSREEVTVSITGVWMAQRKGKLLPCFDHIPLKARRVFIVFDSDVMAKKGVQDALERTVPLLEKRGADVRVIYLPNASDGSKQGVDDYLAAGGTVPELKALARKFVPADIKDIRLSRNEMLAAAIRELWRTYEAMPKMTQGQNTQRSVMRALITAVEQNGTVVDGGVKVARSVRQLALDAAISHTSVRKQLAKLEERKVLHRNRPRKKDYAQDITLLADTKRAQGFHQKASAQDALKGRANGFHQGRTAHKYRSSEVRANGFHDGSLSSVPSPAPSSEHSSLHNGNQMRSLILRGSIPEMRWSTFVVHMEQSHFSGEWLEVREYVARLGKKRAAIVEHLARYGPEVTVSELMEEFAGARARQRDFIRRNITPLGDFGIVTHVNGTVSLCDDWLQGMADARELGGEQRQTELQKERYQRQREAYKNRHNIHPEPVAEPPQLDDMSKPWSHHAEGCACRKCESRFGKVIGEHIEECQCSECRAERYGKAPKLRRTPLKLVAPLEVPREPEPPAPVDTPNHSLDCQCPECLYPMPKYARPWKGAR